MCMMRRLRKEAQELDVDVVDQQLVKRVDIRGFALALDDEVVASTALRRIASPPGSSGDGAVFVAGLGEHVLHEGLEELRGLACAVYRLAELPH